jgi:predicted Rossmann fold nucleotide-binding protein DprA/Smf involved in DNA uptake
VTACVFKIDVKTPFANQDLLQRQSVAFIIRGPATASGSCDNDLLKIIGYDPVSLNVLAARAGVDAATMNAQVLLLEMDGQVELLPGGLIRRLS